MNDTLNQINLDIILPNYNSYLHIEETLNSIIGQTFKNWNLLIVDDNSDDKTKNILRKYQSNEKIKIFWLKQNKGAGFCRNLAISNSNAKYIAFIDSDDIWEKEKISKQLNFMEKNKYFFTCTNYQPFKHDKKNINLKEIKPVDYFTFEKFIKDTSIATSTMIIERSLIGNTKFTNTKICEDYFFKCEILKKANKAYCLKENLTKYRVSKNSLQSNKFRNFYWIWYINKNYNKLNFFKNLISLLCISINSIKKYGFK